MEDLRLLVFGGRNYTGCERVFEGIWQIASAAPLEKIMIIHGACNLRKRIGADYWAHLFCQRWWHLGIKEMPYPAKWDDLSVPHAAICKRANGTKYNVRAGFDRNQFMLDDGKPTHALGTPGGNGTADMKRRIERANEAGAGIILKMIEE